MNFVSGLPLISVKKYSIWVIVDQFSKSLYFQIVHTNYSMERLTELYVGEIV